jgi:hypothetical protein
MYVLIPIDDLITEDARQGSGQLAAWYGEWNTLFSDSDPSSSCQKGESDNGE